jgi:N-acetylglucosaminyldiphosphoundecaprenol N-acetyl-beta-D-mannosaminyltransferase
MSARGVIRARCRALNAQLREGKPMLQNEAVRRITILNSPVDAVTMQSALALIKSYVKTQSKPGYILAINPEKVYTLLFNRPLRAFTEGATLLLPDGIGVVLAARILLGARLSRVTGADLMQSLCAEAAREHYRIFLFGASEEVNRRTGQELRRRYPGIQIAGRLNGYSGAQDTEAAIRIINAAQADILFLALGSPRQENWIAENLPRLNVKLCQGVGGTFDTIAGTVKRAPGWVQSLGLEWFYRFAHQPARAGRLMTVFKFAALVLVAKFRG